LDSFAKFSPLKIIMEPKQQAIWLILFLQVFSIDNYRGSGLQEQIDIPSMMIWGSLWLSSNPLCLKSSSIMSAAPLRLLLRIKIYELSTTKSILQQKF
jgi:hypothetical protein